MTWSVRFTRSAEEDLREARDWYRTNAPHVTAALRRELRDAHQRLGENPLQYPEVHPGVRRALIYRFPYAIFFVVQHQTVRVIALTHQARNPDRWRRRV